MILHLELPRHVVTELEILVLQRHREARVVAAVEDERRARLPHEAVAGAHPDGVPERLQVEAGALGCGEAVNLIIV